MKLFGMQMELVGKILIAKRSVATMGSASSMKEKIELAQQFSRIVMQAIATILGLIGCFLVILYSKDATASKAAFGILGVIFGYWMR